jgi:ankyrin repeat protein
MNEASLRRRPATLGVGIVLAVAALLGMGERTAASPPSAEGTFIPKVEPLEPAPFTLEDRYLDAARRGDMRMLELCLEKGVNPHAKDSFGRSALLLAARDARSLAMVEFLAGRGLAVDEPDIRGRAALGYAAGSGDLQIVEYLLAHGAVVDRKDDMGQTPLFNAVLGGSRETVARLAAEKVDIDARDRYGDTPLIGACAKGHDDVARLLVEKGANPRIKDQEGRTARERAPADAAYCRGLP